MSYSKNIKNALKLWGFLLASGCIHTDAFARSSGLKRQRATVLSFSALGDLDTVRRPDGVSEQKLKFKSLGLENKKE